MQDKNFLSIGSEKLQQKLLIILLLDKNFCDVIFDVIKEEYFSKQYLKVIFKNIGVYLSEYQKIPSVNILKEILSTNEEIIKDEFVNEKIVEFFKQIDNMDETFVDDFEYIKDNALEFCKYNATKEALIDSLSYLNDNEKHVNYENITATIEKITTKDNKSNLLKYEKLNENITDSLINEFDKTVPTGIKDLDVLLPNGGVPITGLGFLIAPTGYGKSHFLINMTSNAIENGFNVLYVSAELREKRIRKRLYANLIKKKSNDINELDDAIIKEKLKDIKGKCIIKFFPSKSASIQEIKKLIKKVEIIEKIKLDLVIIDYADLFTYDGKVLYEKNYQMLSDMYQELRGYGGLYNVAMWTVSQANREGVGQEIFDLDKIAEAFGKTAPADVVLCLGRTRKDQLNGTATLMLAKNRDGEGQGTQWFCKMDTATSSFEVLNEKNSFYNEDSKKELLEERFQKLVKGLKKENK